jgi:tetratricopeptide (TPR) repeat protein
MRSGNLFAELKQRNVYRAAFAYGVVAWFLTQLTTILAETLTGLGEREAALRLADRAVELLPSSHDARSGPAFEATRARIQARFGDGDRAIPTLKHLLEYHTLAP